MGLFKKKNEIISTTGADLKVLGKGCKNCAILSENALQALQKLELPTEIEKVENMSDIAKYGVMSTPALVYQEQVISYGKVLTVEQIQTLLKNEH